MHRRVGYVRLPFGPFLDFLAATIMIEGCRVRVLGIVRLR